MNEFGAYTPGECEIIDFGYLVVRRKLYSDRRQELDGRIKWCPPRCVGLSQPVKVPYSLGIPKGGGE